MLHIDGLVLLLHCVLVELVEVEVRGCGPLCESGLEPSRFNTFGHALYCSAGGQGVLMVGKSEGVRSWWREESDQ